MERDVSLNRVPPQNCEAEQAALGAMLLDNNAIPRAQALLTAENFYREAHRIIFEAMLAVHASERRVDLVLLSNFLRAQKRLDQVGGTAYLASLVDNVASAELLPHYASIIKKKAILRRLIGSCSELVTLAYDDRLPGEEILGQAQLSIAALTKDWVDDGTSQRLDLPVKHLLDYFATCCETPWPSVNEALGGLFSGELIVVGGLPGVGKSTFAHAIMRHVAMTEGKPVAYFGPQMSPEKVAVRQLAAMCHIPENDIKRGKINKEQLARLEAANQRINAAEIYREIVGEEISAFSLMAHVRRFTDKAKRPMGLVIVENLQQITMPGKREGKESKDAVLSALRAFGTEMKITFYISSQLNEPEEGAKDRRPTISDLRSTGNTKEIADKIILLHRLGYHPRDKVLKKSEPGEVIAAKGAAAIVLPFTFVGPCFNWEEAREGTKEE